MLVSIRVTKILFVLECIKVFQGVLKNRAKPCKTVQLLNQKVTFGFNLIGTAKWQPFIIYTVLRKRKQI